jgi:hypothetical protein
MGATRICMGPVTRARPVAGTRGRQAATLAADRVNRRVPSHLRRDGVRPQPGRSGLGRERGNFRGAQDVARFAVFAGDWLQLANFRSPTLCGWAHPGATAIIGSVRARTHVWIGAMRRIRSAWSDRNGDRGDAGGLRRDPSLHRRPCNLGRMSRRSRAMADGQAFPQRFQRRKLTRRWRRDIAVETRVTRSGHGKRLDLNRTTKFPLGPPHLKTARTTRPCH